MARTPKDITDAELAVLEALWRDGPSTVRELVDQLYPGGGNSEFATVQKLCERLAAKGYTASDRRFRPRRFRPAVQRRELIGRQLRTMAEKFCDGSLKPLLSHLVADAGLSPEEIQDLRDLVDRLDQTRAGKRRE